MGGFRKVGLITCTALALANMIGTGVFTSLGFQVPAIPSPFLILLVWALGGVVALCGALSYAELSAALPRSGGEYNFLSAIYHPAVGFMGGFISVTVGFSAPIALSAMALGKYMTAALPGIPAALVSVVAVVLLAAAHSLTVRASGNFQVVITSLKVGLITAFIGLGFLLRGPFLFAPREGDFSLILGGPFAVSLMFVLYSYSGWNAAAYIIGEVREPQRTVPAALLLATVIVTILYVFLNAAFLASGPMDSFSGKDRGGGDCRQEPARRARRTRDGGINCRRFDFLHQRDDLGGPARRASGRAGLSRSTALRLDVPGRRSARGHWCADAPGIAVARDLDV